MRWLWAAIALLFTVHGLWIFLGYALYHRTVTPHELALAASWSYLLVARFAASQMRKGEA